MAPATPPSARYAAEAHARRRRARRTARSARTAAAAGWPAGRRPRRRAQPRDPARSETPTRPAGGDDRLEDLVGGHRRHAERALGDERRRWTDPRGAGRRSRRARSPPPAGPSRGSSTASAKPARNTSRSVASLDVHSSSSWSTTRTSSPPSGAMARTARSIARRRRQVARVEIGAGRVATRDKRDAQLVERMGARAPSTRPARGRRRAAAGPARRGRASSSRTPTARPR